MVIVAEGALGELPSALRFVPAVVIDTGKHGSRGRIMGTLMGSPFNIVIAGRAARTSTHDRHSRIRCLETVLLCDRIEIGRGNVSTHVESPDLDG
jgi:hypothetical protein